MDVRWIAVAVALIASGIGIWMKVSDGSLKNKKGWGSLGTVFILTGMMIAGVTILGTFGVQFRSPIIFNDEQSQEANAQFPKWPDPYRPISVINKTFRNTEVMLDGYAYDHCRFENVTFVYNGTTPTQVTLSKIEGQTNFRTDNPAVDGMMAMLKGFGYLPDINLIFSKPNNIVREPGESIE